VNLSRTVSEINGDIAVANSQNFHTRVFNAPAKDVSLGIGYRRNESKKLE